MHHERARHAAPHTTGRIIRWARLYNLLFARNPTGVHKEALRAAAPQPGEKTIDVGCGPGTMAIVLSQKVAPGGEAVGIDASLEMIDVARKKAKRERSTARFEPAAIPLRAVAMADAYRLKLRDGQAEVAVVSMGNPHAVLHVADTALADVAGIGPQIENHPDFP